MKKTILEENPDKAIKRISKKVSLQNAFSYFALGENDEYKGKIKDGKISVFIPNKHFFSFLNAVLVMEFVPSPRGCEIWYKFRRPLGTSIFLAILSLLFIYTALISLDDLIFAAFIFIMGIIALLPLFIFKKKTKEKLLNIIENDRSDA